MTAVAAGSSGASLRQAIAPSIAAAAREEAAAYVAFTVRAPVADPAVVHELLEAPRACWMPDRSDGWSVAAGGEAARVEASGATRFAEVRARGGAILRRVAVRSLDVCEAPAPRLLGGFAFAPRPARRRGEPWASFGDASFVLPRWTYAVRGSAAVLTLTGRRSELSDAGAWAERIVELLDRIGLAARARVPAPIPTHGAIVAGDASFEHAVGAALSAIRSRRFEKVVVATGAFVTVDTGVDPASVLARLSAAHPETTRFAFERGDVTFAGASPERLAEVRGRAVELDALAGTAPRASDARADREIARALASSDKDLAEHGVVVRALASAAASACEELAVPASPTIRTLRNVHHLWTPIRGRLREGVHVLDLVERLHPTPAVGGHPREPALAWLAEHEHMDRGWYAAPVGWLDAAGDGFFVVALRSGVLGRRAAWLFAGAGIVEGSDPSRELAEVRAKRQPMLAALGVSP